MYVHLYPSFAGEDKGDGGVRRVWEGMMQSLPQYGIQPVDDPAEASVIGCHITCPEAFVRRFADRPLIAHCHGLYWSEYEWEEWAYKANDEVAKLIRLADIVTAPSEWVADVIRRHWSRDVRVIHHGVNVEEFNLTPRPPHRGYVLWNKTRLDPVCDNEAVNLLAARLPHVPFVTTFGNSASNVHVTSRLPFEQAKALVQHAAIYLCTTRETFGIGTLEAMAAGVPIVGYAYGGQMEIVREGIDGVLVPPGDIDALKAAVEHCLAHRDEMSERAVERAHDFTWARAGQQYANIYREAAACYDREIPRTSIIVTAYKLDRYLPDTLKSVLAQTDEDWECIVVDDASPDGCGVIADAFARKDSRIHVIHNETNQYLAEARNIGIRESQGRYILPLDADDKLTPDAVQKLADYLDEDRHTDIAYGNVFFTEEDGKTPTNYNVRSQQPGHSGWPMQFSAIDQITGKNLLPYSSIFRRRVWELTGGYRRRLRTAEDADFWTRATSYGFTATYGVPTDTLIYRNRPGSMSREQEKQRYNYLRWYPWAAMPTLAPGAVGGSHAISLLDPHVTVVIPVGPGHHQLVQDAVDSVTAQSYPFWQCIVVNDSGSPLHVPPFVKVINTNVRDPASARNIGIAAATTSYYLPLDADDYLQPDALQWLMTAATEAPGEIIYPDFFKDDNDHGEQLPAGEYVAWKLPDFDCEKLIRNGAIHAITALTPVRVWQAVGGYRSGVAWEDWDFQMRCATEGYCSRRIAAPLFTYRKFTGKRRDYDRKEFERRKEQMINAWPEYFRGGKSMACGCGAKTISPRAGPLQASGPPPSHDEAVMVEYTGDRSGVVRYRGKGGTIYSFSRSQPPQYVLENDLEMFLRMRDFHVVQNVPQGGPVLA